jgi:hypothetical protein
MRIVRTLAVAAVVVASVAVPTTSAVATSSWPLYRVDSEIRVHMVDARNPGPDQHCVYSGTTTQDVVEGTPEQLGTGRPSIDYPPSRGPFRDAAGPPILFVCGSGLSLCLHPSGVSVVDLQRLTIDIVLTMYEGHGVAFPCDPPDEVDRDLVRLASQYEGRRCLAEPGVVLTGSDGDRVTVEQLCATLDFIGVYDISPRIASLACASFGGRIVCDVVYTSDYPTSIGWSIGGGHVPALDDLSTITGPCVPGSTVHIGVSVANLGAGGYDKEYTTVTCS